MKKGILIRALKEALHFILIRNGLESMLTCGDRIKELRRQKRISQTELAEIAGVKKNTVSTWERDTRRPDQRALKKLAEYFGVSWEYLLGEGSDTQTSLTV